MEDELKTKESEAKQLEEKFDFLGASILYQESLKIAKTIGKSEKIKELKLKLRSASQKIVYKSLSVEQEVSTELINRLIDLMVNDGNLSEIFNRLGNDSNLYPRIDVILEQAKKTIPVSYQIATIVTHSPDGHLIEGGADPILAWNAKVYSINQGVISNLYLRRIFQRLRNEKVLDSNKFYEYLNKSNIFTDNSLSIIKIGIDRYFTDDYISAIHILIPQFENAFLRISETFGVDIIALNQSTEVSTRTRVLSENLLSKQELQNLWGPDFCEQIKFVLLDPLGYKLRHKVAHGEISLEECNKNNIELLLYFYIVLINKISSQKPNIDL